MLDKELERKWATLLIAKDIPELVPRLGYFSQNELSRRISTKEQESSTSRDRSETLALPAMSRSTLSKYEHQFELELVNEAVKDETTELKRLKYRHRKSWGIPTLKEVVDTKKRKKRRIKCAEDMFRAAAERRGKKKTFKKVDEMEPTGMGKVWMTRRRVDGKVSVYQYHLQDQGLGLLTVV